MQMADDSSSVKEFRWRSPAEKPVLHLEGYGFLKSSDVVLSLSGYGSAPFYVVGFLQKNLLTNKTTWVVKSMLGDFTNQVQAWFPIPPLNV